MGEPRKSGVSLWYGTEGVLRKTGAFCIWTGLADFAESAWAGAPVATSSAIVAAKQMRFFIVISFFLGAVRRFLLLLSSASRVSRLVTHKPHLAEPYA